MISVLLLSFLLTGACRWVVDMSFFQLSKDICVYNNCKILDSVCTIVALTMKASQLA